MLANRMYPPKLDSVSAMSEGQMSVKSTETTDSQVNCCGYCEPAVSVRPILWIKSLREMAGHMSWYSLIEHQRSTSTNDMVLIVEFAMEAGFSSVAPKKAWRAAVGLWSGL